MAAFAEFERARIMERVRAGLARARAQGRRLGRPAQPVDAAALERTRHLSVRTAAAAVGVSPSVLYRARAFQKRLRRTA